jgi:hypothetical protein
MTRLSRLGLALLLTPLLAAAGCTCSLKGCLEGLLVTLAGNFEPGKTYQLDIDTATSTPEIVSVMRCSLVRTEGRALDVRCSSAHRHSELGGVIQIHSHELGKLIVTVSADGAMLGQQTLEASYETKEINGPGCGTCTNAEVVVTIP